MKRIMMLAMVLVMLLTSIGGCWPWWYGPGGPERGGGHDRNGSHSGPRGPQGGGPGGGGHDSGGPGGGH